MAPVLIALERWNPSGGGRERYAAELRLWLQRRGVDVRVACAVGVTGDAVERCGSVASLHAFVARWRRDHPSAPALAMIPIAAASHAQLHSGLTALAWPAGREALGGGLRRRLHPLLSALDASRRQYRRDETALLSGAARLMAFSSGDADAVVAQGVDRTRVTVSRPGIDTARFGPPRERSSGDPLHVVFAGHNPRLKGFRACVAGIAGAARAGIPLRVTAAGRGSRIAALRHRLDVPRGVSLTAAGELPQPDLIAVLQQADVLLHPAFYDPFPRVVLEAMACGCVPIVSRQCGVAELIASGRNGFVVDEPGDAGGIAAALAAARDATRLSPMRRRAATLAASLDFDTHAAAVLEWLH